MPLLYVLGAVVAGALGYLRYEQIKVGDLVRFKDEHTGVAATMKVIAVDSKKVAGTVIVDLGGVSKDSEVPVEVFRRNVIANLTPRLA